MTQKEAKPVTHPNTTNCQSSFSVNLAVHTNESLSPVENMNYLRAKFEGEAAGVISGLTLTNGNYQVVMQLLQKRIGPNEIILNVHHTTSYDKIE